MAFKRLLRPTNGRMRLGVGLLLAALFCMQCTSSSQAVRSAGIVQVIDGAKIGDVSKGQLADLEQLAKTDHVALLKLGLKHCGSSYRDYTCTFIKQERINGQLKAEQWMDVKFRETPFSVAMVWTKNAPIGDKLLFVEGRYNGQMLVNPGSALLRVLTGGAVLRQPDGSEAMANTLRPVTMFGFKRMMENLLMVYEQAAAKGDLKMSFLGYREIDGHKVLAMQRELPAASNYPAKITTWYFDPELMIPLGMEATDWDDQIQGTYTYKNVKLNVGLDDAAFTPEGNGMKFKG